MKEIRDKVRERLRNLDPETTTVSELFFDDEQVNQAPTESEEVGNILDSVFGIRTQLRRKRKLEPSQSSRSSRKRRRLLPLQRMDKENISDNIPMDIDSD